MGFLQGLYLLDYFIILGAWIKLNIKVLMGHGCSSSLYSSFFPLREISLSPYKNLNPAKGNASEFSP